ncbi:unnamed protein product [Brassica rapa subsp. trilocularis]
MLTGTLCLLLQFLLLRFFSTSEDGKQFTSFFHIGKKAKGELVATWNSGISSLCIFCQRKTETRGHIFFDCAFSEEMWSLLT